METFAYTITDENGIHARPAGQIVQCAKGFRSQILLRLPVRDRTANAVKLFAVMGLGAKKGDTIYFEAQGEDEAEAIAALRSLLLEAGL